MFTAVVFPATQSPSSLSPLKFYTFPQGEYTVLSGDQFYLNCTAGGRYDSLLSSKTRRKILGSPGYQRDQYYWVCKQGTNNAFLSYSIGQSQT